MLNFISTGMLGPFHMGLSRVAVIARCGAPVDWVGKPPSFGPRIVDPMQADIWNYYSGAVGVFFNRQSEVGAIIIRVKFLKNCGNPLSNWPVAASWKIGDIIEWARLNGVEYIKSRHDEIPPWIVVGGRCVVASLPVFSGQSVGRHEEEEILTLVVFSGWPELDYYRRTGCLMAIEEKATATATPSFPAPVPN